MSLLFSGFYLFMCRTNGDDMQFDCSSDRHSFPNCLHWCADKATLVRAKMHFKDFWNCVQQLCWIAANDTAILLLLGDCVFVLYGFTFCCSFEFEHCASGHKIIFRSEFFSSDTVRMQSIISKKKWNYLFFANSQAINGSLPILFDIVILLWASLKWKPVHNFY